MAQREALSQVRISVRNLVEFVMRSGDLDDRRMDGPMGSSQSPAE